MRCRGPRQRHGAGLAGFGAPVDGRLATRAATAFSTADPRRISRSASHRRTQQSRGCKCVGGSLTVARRGRRDDTSEPRAREFRTVIVRLERATGSASSRLRASRGRGAARTATSGLRRHGLASRRQSAYTQRVASKSRTHPTELASPEQLSTWMNEHAGPAREDDTPVLAGQVGPRRRATREELLQLVNEQRHRYGLGPID